MQPSYADITPVGLSVKREGEHGRSEPAALRRGAPYFLTFTTGTASDFVLSVTYVWTLEGWAYLAVLIDLGSRRVVGWALRRSLSRELALGALRRAVRARGDVRGLVHHTDVATSVDVEMFSK